MDNNLFNSMEKKTGVKMGDIMQLANSLQSANLKDEDTVRKVINKVAELANKPVSKEIENKLVSSIVNDGEKLNLNKITDILEEKKKK